MIDFHVAYIVNRERRIQCCVSTEICCWIRCCRVEHLGGETECRLCGIRIEKLTILRTHLMSRLHKQREQALGFSRPLFENFE